MSDEYDDNHGRRSRFAHVVLRIPDNMDLDDVEAGIQCLIGHAMDGHGMRPANVEEFAHMLLDEGGIERMLKQLKEVEEKFEMRTSTVKVKLGLNDNPFEILNDKDEVLH